MLSYCNNDINDEKRSSHRKTKRLVCHSESFLSYLESLTEVADYGRYCCSETLLLIAQNSFQDGFAKQNMSGCFPTMLDIEDASTNLTTAEQPKPIPFTVANLPKRRKSLKPYVASVTSKKYFATISKAPRDRCKMSKIRMDELPYAPHSQMPMLVTKEKVDDFEDISRALQDPKRKRKDLVPNRTLDRDEAEEYDYVDIESDEILNIVVSDSEDEFEFEVVEKLAQSEHNGTTMKWHKGYRQ